MNEAESLQWLYSRWMYACLQGVPMLKPSTPQQFAIIAPYEDEETLRKNVLASPGLVGRKVIGVKGASSASDAWEQGKTQSDADWFLLTHPDVQQAAVMAVKDELREEEVFACVVLKRKVPDKEAAMALFQHCYERLAYYKAPGWIHVVDTLPTTGTQKIQKHSIYPSGIDPRSIAAVVDLSALKKRGQL